MNEERLRSKFMQAHREELKSLDNLSSIEDKIYKIFDELSDRIRVYSTSYPIDSVEEEKEREATIKRLRDELDKLLRGTKNEGNS